MFFAWKGSSRATGTLISGWILRPIRAPKPFSSASTLTLSSCRSCCVQAARSYAILVRRTLPAASVSSDQSIPQKSMTWPSSAPDRRVSLRRSMRRRRVFRWSCWIAAPLAARLCAGQEVALVGAGNSAGQAAVYLASQVAKVWLLVRGSGLEASMSRYLIDRIAGLPNVEVLMETEVSALEGQGGVLEAIRWRRRSTGREVRQPVHHLFLFIGADPNTDWLS